MLLEEEFHSPSASGLGELLQLVATNVSRSPADSVLTKACSAAKPIVRAIRSAPRIEEKVEAGAVAALIVAAEPVAIRDCSQILPRKKFAVTWIIVASASGRRHERNCRI